MARLIFGCIHQLLLPPGVAEPVLRSLLRYAESSRSGTCQPCRFLSTDAAGSFGRQDSNLHAQTSAPTPRLGRRRRAKLVPAWEQQLLADEAAALQGKGGASGFRAQAARPAHEQAEQPPDPLLRGQRGAREPLVRAPLPSAAAGALLRQPQVAVQGPATVAPPRPKYSDIVRAKLEASRRDREAGRERRRATPKPPSQFAGRLDPAELTHHLVRARSVAEMRRLLLPEEEGQRQGAAAAAAAANSSFIGDGAQLPGRRGLSGPHINAAFTRLAQLVAECECSKENCLH